jgi:hypothetical protein
MDGAPTPTLVDRVHETDPAILELVDEMERTGWMPPIRRGRPQRLRAPTGSTSARDRRGAAPAAFTRRARSRSHRTFTHRRATRRPCSKVAVACHSRSSRGSPGTPRSRPTPPRHCNTVGARHIDGSGVRSRVSPAHITTRDDRVLNPPGTGDLCGSNPGGAALTVPIPR